VVRYRVDGDLLLLAARGVDTLVSSLAPAAGEASGGGETNLVKNVFLPIALGIIMFGMGLTLGVADFARVARRPQAVITGLVLQMVALPLLGLGVVAAFGLSGIWAVGVLLLAVCPGGTTSNFIAHLSRGDTALSITLTAINSVITVVSIPLLVAWFLDAFLGQTRPVTVDAATMMAQIALITVLPVGLGMTLRARARPLAARLERPVRLASIVLFTIIVIGAVAKEKDKVAVGFAEVGLACLTLNVLAMAVGYGVALALRFDRRAAITMGVEVGIQNATLAIVLATTSLDVDRLSFPPAVYGLTMFATAGVFGWWVNRVPGRSAP